MRADPVDPHSTPDAHAASPARDGIDRDTLMQLGSTAPLHLGRAVLFEWTAITAAIALAVQAGSVGVSALVMVFVATRQHALLVLMHEFSHRHFSRSHPVLNDVIGDFLCALPFTITIHGYRRDHTAHHRHTSTPDDPNWMSCANQDRFTFPRPLSSTAWTLTKHALGLYGLRELKSALVDAKMASACPAGTRWRQGVFVVGVVAVLTGFGLWAVWATYWLLPMLTGLVAILYWRDVAEHFALPSEGLQASRTVLPHWWERLVIAPHQVGFHTEHHLYPSVPSNRLPRLHALLMRDARHAATTVVTHGYFSGLLRETARFGAAAARTETARKTV